MLTTRIENYFSPPPSRKEVTGALNRQFPRYVDGTRPVLEFALEMIDRGGDLVDHERRAAVGLMITLEGYHRITGSDPIHSYSFDEVQGRGTFPIGPVQKFGYRQRSHWQLEGMAMEYLLDDVDLRLGELRSRGDEEAFKQLQRDRGVLGSVSYPYHYLHFGEKMHDDVRITLEALAISSNPLRRSKLQGKEKMDAEWFEAENIIGNRMTPRKAIWGSRRELRIPL